ncbi:MAG TPA: APC family permease [Acidimicrobiales bacterium]|nr:APC family permease [Acidimicrobiales bacterium]
MTTDTVERDDSLARRVDEALADGAPDHSLVHHQLKFARTIALSVGIQGPVAGVIVGPAVLASIVGGAGALAYLLGFVAMAFVAYAFVIFSRSFNSSGSVYAFNGAALGPTFGFASAWILLLVYVSFAGAVYASTADIAQALFASWGVHVWWVWFALAGFVLTMLFAYLSIAYSSLVIFFCEGVAVVLLAIVGIVVLAKGGYHHHAFSASPFMTHGVAFGVLGLGVVNAFGAFSGFEGAATLGEESKRSTRTIPAAVALSLVGAAAVYIVFTWIADNAYPSASALAADPAPFVHLATISVGSWMGTAVNIAGVISAFGAQLACINAANRLVFALGREVGGTERGLGALLTRTSRRTSSPIGALALTGGASIAALLAFSFEQTAIRALVLIVEFGAYLIIVAYLLTVIAAVAWVWRHGRRSAPLIALSVGVAVLGYVLYDTFHPFPAAPFDWVVSAAAGSALLGVLVAFIPSVRARLVGSTLLRVTRQPALPALVET